TPLPLIQARAAEGVVGRVSHDSGFDGIQIEVADEGGLIGVADDSLRPVSSADQVSVARSSSSIESAGVNALKAAHCVAESPGNALYGEVKVRHHEAERSDLDLPSMDQVGEQGANSTPV